MCVVLKVVSWSKNFKFTVNILASWDKSLWSKFSWTPVIDCLDTKTFGCRTFSIKEFFLVSTTRLRTSYLCVRAQSPLSYHKAVWFPNFELKGLLFRKARISDFQDCSLGGVCTSESKTNQGKHTPRHSLVTQLDLCTVISRSLGRCLIDLRFRTSSTVVRACTSREPKSF